MDLAGYVINAVVVEGRSVAEVAACHDISRSWLYELLARFRERGDDALKPGSRRPRSSPTQVASAMEDEIVALRKSLSEEGLDAGAQTIHYHLLRRHRRRPQAVPSVATIWCILSRRGFVVAQPHKRPRSSWKRFQAELPNECWQADTRHWALADGSDVEVLNVVDDHSRLLIASRAFVTTKAADVVETFHLGVADRRRWPSSRPSWIASAPTTTPCGPIGHSDGAHRRKPSPPAPRQRRSSLRSTPRATTACAGTASTKEGG